jgi:rfaE bifunctional protein kinase chain/domain
MLRDKVLAVRDNGMRPTVLVVGDLMIDHYIWGEATRLSPEAPVPVVNVTSESTTLGGAANVAQNLIALGAKVILAGVTGDDVAGKQLHDILLEENVITDCIVKDKTRPTTVKTRVLAGSHQLVRIDRETTDAVSITLEDELLARLTEVIDNVDIIVISDYNSCSNTKRKKGNS